jgi:FdrA protein
MSERSNVRSVPALLREGPRVANVGIREFADSLAEQEVPVVQVDWAPPPKLEPDLAELLERLE